MITREMLEGQIKSLTALRDDALVTYHKACGALELANYLLKQFDGMTENELAEMVAGEGASVEGIEPSG